MVEQDTRSSTSNTKQPCVSSLGRILTIAKLTEQLANKSPMMQKDAARILAHLECFH